MRLLDTPEFNIALFAFLLNLPWEFWQVPFFAGMPSTAHWEGVRACTRAAAGDAGIALAAFGAVAVLARSRRWILRPRRCEAIGFVAVGLLVTIVFEWLATGPLERWRYAPSMPRLPLLGTGMLPVLQWIVIPPLVLWFVKRQVGCTVGAVAPEHREGRREV